jgi:GNAT superfamily N-acetyltransferase
MTDRALSLAIERLVDDEFGDTIQAVRRALVVEHLRALEGGDARRAFVVLGPRREAGVVVAGSIPARGWILGLTRDASGALLDELESTSRALGPDTRLRVGGPPGSYFRSGLNGRDVDRIAWFAARGYAEEKRHVDLLATLAPPIESDPRVRRADRSERERLLGWMTDRFAPAWQIEVDRAFSSDAVFVAGQTGAYEGFAAHSGNNAALGTFGPVGVDESARRGGLGAALSRTVLDDLVRRGHTVATIPWVDPTLVGFYQRITARIEVVDRVVMAKSLT